MAKRNNSKRDMILDAAYNLFIEKGYWDTKIIDIADAAGIGKGTVYEYFESKDEIIFELFKTRVAASYEQLPELLNREIPCEAKIKEYLDIELSNTARFAFNKNFLTDLMMKSDAFRNPELIHSILKLVRDKFSILHQIIEDGIIKGELRKTDSLLAAVAVMGAINFYVSIDYAPVDPCYFLPIERKESWSNDEFFTLIMHGLKP
jgi:AcrR family transcriptional regulator